MTSLCVKEHLVCSILFGDSEPLAEVVGQGPGAPTSGGWYCYDLCHLPHQSSPGWISCSTYDVWVIYSHLNYYNKLLTGLFASNLILLLLFLKQTE